MEVQYHVDSDDISLFDVWRIIRNSLTRIIAFCFITTVNSGDHNVFFYT